MGTNYYARVKECPACKHPAKEMHIGKSSAGWTFTFQALRDYETHDGEPIHSWKRWQEVLNQPDVAIRDEYDKQILLDDFIRIVESSKNQPLKHHPYCLQKYGQDDGFLDDDGNSFSWGYFS